MVLVLVASHVCWIENNDETDAIGKAAKKPTAVGIHREDSMPSLLVVGKGPRHIPPRSLGIHQMDSSLE